MRSAGVILLGLTGAWGHGKVSKVKILYKLDVKMFPGSMYSPSPWWATSDCHPNEEKFTACEFKLQTPRAEPRCFRNEKTNGCNRSGGRNAWFTNFTRVPEVIFIII